MSKIDSDYIAHNLIKMVFPKVSYWVLLQQAGVVFLTPSKAHATPLTDDQMSRVIVAVEELANKSNSFKVEVHSLFLED